VFFYEAHDLNQLLYLCDSCEQNTRSLFRLSNGIILLICNECSSAWDNPYKTDWFDGQISDEDLRKRSGVEDTQPLYDDGRPPTREEVEATEWKILLPH